MFAPIRTNRSADFFPSFLYASFHPNTFLIPSSAMSFAPSLRLCARRVAASPAIRPRFTFTAARKLHNVPPRQDKPGKYAQTDPQIEVEYPEDHELPSSEPVSGAGGQYVKPTLPTFTLDGHVGIVTGGARGLGLVMGQGMVFSGSNLALVDMNSKSLYLSQQKDNSNTISEEEAEKQTSLIIEEFKKENPRARR
jgi:D-arabinitol 2-dehydrogenase